MKDAGSDGGVGCNGRTRDRTPESFENVFPRDQLNNWNRFFLRATDIVLCTAVKQGRMHDNSCRGQIGRGSYELGRGSND